MNAIPTSLTPSEFDALTRLDLPSFIERVFYELNPTEHYFDNFHIHVLAAELEATRRGEQPRLIVNLPPRNTKTIIVSVAFVAWLLGHDPALKIICVSYGQDLAEIPARHCRQVMQSEWYRRLFPKTVVSPTRSAVDFFETTAGGYRIATSIGGVLTGLGGDYILIDDPVKPDETLSDAERTRVNMWYRHTLITRLNDKRRGRIAIVMQRLHEDDMVGHVVCLEPWKVVALPAIAQMREDYVIPTAFGPWKHRREEGEALDPEREPLEELERYRRIQGPEIFTAQFLQAPVPPGGNLVKIDKLRRFDSNKPPDFEQTIQSWDTASKATQLSSYSVCTVWGIMNKQIYLNDVIRDRFEYPDLRGAALALARGGYRGHRRPDQILIEDKGSGQSLIQDLKRDDISNVTAIRPEADKKIRMNSQTAVIADGRVLIPYDAPWLAEYLQELIAFPLGKHDDQVDSTSQALKWFSELTDMPGFIGYCLAQLEEMRNGKKDDRRIVSLSCSNPSMNVVCTISRAQVVKGGDGLFRMEWQDAEGLLRTPGWAVVDDSSSLPPEA